MALTLAITGGTGFVGGHTLSEALRRGHRVRVLARTPQQPRDSLDWIAGSLTDSAALDSLVEGADVLLHIAGVTNAPSPAAFTQGNVLGTAFVRRAAGSRPLVHVSSLSAREPALSRYGASKLQGEQVARGAAGPVAILRPPAVYGPGDREFLDLLRTARSGFVPMPRASRTAMIYGPDLAEALVALAEDISGSSRTAGHCYEIDDGAGSHSPAQLAAAIGNAIGLKAQALEIPPPLLRLAAVADSAAARLRGHLPRLSTDRAGYMAHPDWSADSAVFRALGIWQPDTPLMEGMAATAIWYRAKGLLK